MSEEVKEIWFEAAERYGWLDERIQAATAETARDTARKTAKKLLELGVPHDIVSIATKLSREEITDLTNEIGVSFTELAASL